MSLSVIRWAIAGFGEIADKAVAPAVLAHPGSELAAICRRNPAELEKFARTHRVDNAFSDYGEMLDWGRFDAVYVATPVDLHAPKTIDALRRGFHVLVEKPMALSVGEAESMIEEARGADLKLGITYYHRLTPLNRKVREIVSAGEIGDLVALHGNASSRFSLDPSHPKYWRVDAVQSGGGPLMDIGTHRLDLFQALAGPAAKVAGFAVRRFIDGDVEDTCSVIIEYRSGVQATFSSLWWVKPGRSDYEVSGTEGRICVPDVRGDILKLERDGDSSEIRAETDELHDLPLIERFVDAVEGGADLELSGDAGLQVQRITDAVYESASAGTIVAI